MTTNPSLPSVLNIAHRGARSVAPENTLAAARKAWEIGADMWELDVGMSADGVPFLIHDNTLNRTSNVVQLFPERTSWAAQEFTWAEIQQLDFGSWFNEQDPFNQIAEGNVSAEEQARFVGERAPSLEDALLFTRDKGWRVNVEIKDLQGTAGDGTIVEQVVALIEALDMKERVILSSFNHEYLLRAKAALPTLATAALVVSAAHDPVALLRQLDAQAYNPGVFAIQPEEIPPLRDSGVPVYVWTVNDEPTMQRLIEHDVSGIFTDFPQRLAKLLGGS